MHEYQLESSKLLLTRDSVIQNEGEIILEADQTTQKWKLSIKQESEKIRGGKQ